MAAASYLQTSFLGGQFSLYYQGRADDERYRKGLAVCLNGLPVEEGAWTRRPGTRFLATTRGGAPGALREFNFTQTHPYNIEFTNGHLRFFSAAALVTDNTSYGLTGITGDPARVVTQAMHGYATGDEITFINPGPDALGSAALLNRQWTITVQDAFSFLVADAVTGVALDAYALEGEVLPLSVVRVLDFITPYTSGSWATNRLVQTLNPQDQEVAVVLNAAYKPYLLTALTPEVPDQGGFATFSWGPSNFLDGPYFDLVADGSIVTPSALSGVVTLTVSYQAWSGSTTYDIGDNVIYGGIGYTSLLANNLNQEPDTSTAYWQVNSGASGVGKNGFVSTDVGRQMRLFSEPPDYNPATAYAIGALVKYQGTYWACIEAGTGQEPDLQPNYWLPSTTAAAWTWGTILTVRSSTSVSLQLRGGNLLYTNPIESYQLGLYSDTTGYPTCGCYLGGRLWLSGAQPNRFDASMSDNPYLFSPTAIDGTVSDANGISGIFNAAKTNAIYWMEPQSQGILCGTKGGEWLIQASALNDPLTPSTVDPRLVTKYGCENVEPADTGLSLVVVQRYGRKVLEYIADVYSGKYSATNISIQAKNLISTGIEELAYVKEPTPIVWGRTAAGALVGCTYKRESPFGTQPASFAGWHVHALGSGRLVQSIRSGPSQDGNVDSVTMITADPVSGICWVEVLTQVFDETTPTASAWFVDAGLRPAKTVPGLTGVTLYGYIHLAGRTISVFGGGLDLGDFPVGADGSLDIPYMGAFTQSVAEAGPFVAGFTFTSQGQMLRPLVPQETGAQNGPALGKTRRSHMRAFLFCNSAGVRVGTDFAGTLHAARFLSPGGNPLPAGGLYSGVEWDTLEDGYSFDSQPTWQITRPWPATILAAEVFVHTQDR